MLNGRLVVHGLDLEPYVERVVDGTLRRRNITLSYHRREDLLAYAVSELWIAAGNDADRYGSFARFADGVVRRKVIDFFRAELGRTKWQFSNGYVHERDRPQILSLDASAGGDRLGSPLGRGAWDPEDCSPDLRRILGAGSRPGLRDEAA